MRGCGEVKFCVNTDEVNVNVQLITRLLWEMEYLYDSTECSVYNVPKKRVMVE